MGVYMYSNVGICELFHNEHASAFVIGRERIVVSVRKVALDANEQRVGQRRSGIHANTSNGIVLDRRLPTGVYHRDI